MWRKSSHCANRECVEWRKSSHSTGALACVEVRGCQVRDSKDPDGPVLTFTGEEWAAFIAGVKAGEFDEFGQQG